MNKLASVLLVVVLSTVSLHAAPGTGMFAQRASKYDAAILPFKNLSSQDVVEQVQSRTEELFEQKRLAMAPRADVARAMRKLGLTAGRSLTPTELQAVARAVGARYVVTGTIHQYRADKKFRLGGFLVHPLGGGATTYGTVEISASAYDAATTRLTWKNAFKTTKKNQFFGVLASRNAVANRALDGALANLYTSFFGSI